MDNRIHSGDIVSVHFNNAQFTLFREARVLYTPTLPGDTWIFQNLETGKVTYVSEPCTITKIGDANEYPFDY